MKAGQVYERFGCKWIVDSIYKVDAETMQKNDLIFCVRYRAHVIEAPKGYAGIREIDAGLRR